MPDMKKTAQGNFLFSKKAFINPTAAPQIENAKMTETLRTKLAKKTPARNPLATKKNALFLGIKLNKRFDYASAQDLAG